MIYRRNYGTTDGNNVYIYGGIAEYLCFNDELVISMILNKVLINCILWQILKMEEIGSEDLFLYIYFD